MTAQKEKNKTRSWMKGAMYLSLGALIAKVLSALYKVPYQNMTGDIGYYVYQQVYPLYGLAFVLGTYGFPVVISGMISKWQSKCGKNPSGEVMIFNRLFVLFMFMMIFNGLIGAGLLLFAEQIAKVMGDIQLAGPIRWLSLPFFIIPFLAVGRGYYQGQGNMVPTMYSQVGEQTIRVIVILLIAIWAMQWDDHYLAGISAGGGAVAGGICGAVILFLYGRSRSYPQISFVSKLRQFKLPSEWKKDVKTLGISSLFVSISAMSIIIMQFFDSFTVLRLLITGGMETETAAAWKGIYDRGWPLIQLGAFVTTAFSYAVVPYLTDAFASGDKQKAVKLVSQSVKVCLVFGGAAAAGLIIIMNNLNPMLFTDQSGLLTLQILSFTVFTGALFMTSAVLLHTAGKASHAAMILLVGLAIKIIGNIAAVPLFGIEGAAASTSLAFLIMAAISIFLLKKESLLLEISWSFWRKWVFSILIMAGLTWIYSSALTELIFLREESFSRIMHSFTAISAALVGGVLFLIVIWYLRIFDKNEWEDLPKISKILPYKSG